MLALFLSLWLMYFVLQESASQQAYYDDCGENMDDLNCCTAPQQINAASGRLCSPYFPESYPENIHCEWKITSPLSSVVLEIRFENFDLELSPGCAYDYLEFRTVAEMPSDNDRVIGRFCGDNKPETFRTSQSQVYVIFHSDVNNICQGFCFSWRSLRDTTSRSETSTTTSGQEDEFGDTGGVTCPLPIISNGNVDCTNTNNVGSTCTSSCIFGYSLTGFTRSTCVLPNGANRAAWLPALPMCLAGLSWGAIALLILGSLGLLGLLCLCCSAFNRKQKQQVAVERPVQYVTQRPQYQAQAPNNQRPKQGRRSFSSTSSPNPCTGNPVTCPICDSITART